MSMLHCEDDQNIGFDCYIGKKSNAAKQALTNSVRCQHVLDSEIGRHWFERGQNLSVDGKLSTWCVSRFVWIGF